MQLGRYHMIPLKPCVLCYVHGVLHDAPAGPWSSGDSGIDKMRKQQAKIVIKPYAPEEEPDRYDSDSSSGSGDSVSEVSAPSRELESKFA